MTEYVASGARCHVSGGHGAPRSHECRCIRPLGHDHGKPAEDWHGCGCGAIWGDRSQYVK